MRKKDENKRKKGQETTIGKIIYGFLLFMPLLAIAVTCGYAIFNKNAYQSYGDKYIKSTQVVNDSSFLQPNNDYSFSAQTFFDNTEEFKDGGKYKFNTSSIEDWNIFISGSGSIPLTPQENETINGFVFYYANNKRLSLYNDDTLVKTIVDNGTSIRLVNLNKTIYFNLKEVADWNIGSYQNTYTTNSTYLITYTIESLSDSFYYAIDKVTENPLFNWAQNSVIYTTTNATCNALSITTPFIPLLLAYWLIISVIYFLYDIALMLVWTIHKKIHELQESI